MTKKLEDILNLPNVKDAFKEVDKKEKDKKMKETANGGTTVSAKNLELAVEAEESYKNLMDLGMNVDSRYSGRIFEVASNFLKNAIDAKSSKIDKKLKMVELQLKKLKLDKEGNKDGSPIEESDGFVISDRNELMKKLLKKG
jgi:hypothetical protein